MNIKIKTETKTGFARITIIVLILCGLASNVHASTEYFGIPYEEYSLSSGNSIQGFLDIDPDTGTIFEVTKITVPYPELLGNKANLDTLVNETGDYWQRSGMEITALHFNESQTRAKIASSRESEIIFSSTTTEEKVVSYLFGTDNPIEWHTDQGFFISAMTSEEDGLEHIVVGITDEEKMQSEENCTAAVIEGKKYAFENGISFSESAVNDYVYPKSIAYEAKSIADLENARKAPDLYDAESEGLIFDAVENKDDAQLCRYIFDIYKVRIGSNMTPAQLSA